MFIMGQTSRRCMVCLMPHSQVSGSVAYPHLSILTVDRPTCFDNRLSAFPRCPWVICASWEVFVSTDVRCTMASKGLELFSPYLHESDVRRRDDWFSVSLLGDFRRVGSITTTIYIYNSVLTCRQHIINSSASAPPNATKIAVKKVSDVDVCMFGPEL